MDNVQSDHTHHRSTRPSYSVCFVAHDVTTPTNIGSLFRIADAFGIERIYLCGASPVPPNAKIRKTARHADVVVPFVYESDPLALVERLRGAGYRIISLEITSSSLDLRQVSLAANDKVCLVLGSEKAGVSQALLDASDMAVHIPMVGRNSSMNIATACAVATFALVKAYLPSPSP